MFTVQEKLSTSSMTLMRPLFRVMLEFWAWGFAQLAKYCLIWQHNGGIIA
jgi:hypothetical protein